MQMGCEHDTPPSTSPVLPETKTCPNSIVDRPGQSKKKPSREITKNHVQQLNHHPMTNDTNIVLRSRSNRRELMDPMF